jgi:hypothetical protein
MIYVFFSCKYTDFSILCVSNLKVTYPHSSKGNQSINSSLIYTKISSFNWKFFAQIK